MTKAALVAVPSALKARLDEIAAATHRSEEEVVEEAISAYLELSDRQVAEIRAGLRQAEAGEPGIPHAEIEKWVRSWGTANELPQPHPRH
jgi:predicted transcriptional regulator